MPERFGRIITPVYRQIETSLVHEGTAVLISTTARFWLFTAAHTLNDPPGRRWLAGTPNVELKPAIWHGDPLDLAFVELTAADAHAMIACGNAFLPLSLVDGNTGDLGNGKMIVTGFPAAAVDGDSVDRVFKVRLTRLTSRFISDQNLRVRRIDHRLQLAGIYKVLEDHNGPIRKLDMRGLSGGGIWHERSKDEVRLVGIVNQYDRKQKVLIGTRIRPLLLEMRKHL